MQIPQETIDQIRDRTDIVDVVSRFVELRRAGSNYKALCPFHEERTPSFNVNPERQIFHCFGCGRGGNVFTFLMEMEGVSFPEAVRALGKQIGVEVESRPERAQDASQNEIFYRISDFAARWYQRNLLERDVGRRARRYLEERGLSESSWTTFGLGYALPGWDGFYRACRAKKIPIEPLRKLKLVSPREGSGGYFDYFRDRVLFPITSPSGRVIAFGGRALTGDVDPKYLNSVESPIYAKRRVLYGLTQAREAIRERRSAILVEGYTDCIAMHLGGFPNTVATCGTATTAEHATLLRRLTRRVVLLPDADPAGEEAALHSGAVFLAAGLDVRVARLEAGLDPDTALSRLGPKKMGEILGAALDYLQYLDYIMTDRPMSPRDKEVVIQRVTAGLGSPRDRLRHEVIVREIARVLGVSTESLGRGRAAVQRTDADTTARADRGGPGARGEAARRAELEKILLRLLLEDTPESAEARTRLDTDDFSDRYCREFYKLLDSAWERHIDVNGNVFQRKAEAVGLEGFAAEITLISVPPGNLGTLLKDTVRRVKELKIRDELKALRDKLQELPEESEEAVAVAEHYAQLRRALMEL